MRRHLGISVCIASLLTVSACSGDSDSGRARTTEGTNATVSAVTDGTVIDSSVSDGAVINTVTDGTATDSTTAGSTSVPNSPGTTGAASPGTTVADVATTVEPPPTTNAVPQNLAELVLRADGLGPLRFGADSNLVVATISSILGAPSSDAAAEYPTRADDGRFVSADQELGFVDPFGRTVCWMNGLCTESGGSTAGPYTFVGWYYAAADADELSTGDGVDVGSRWADFTTVMTVEPGGCSSIGSGSSAGISLTLQSKGVPFSSIADDGSQTAALPDPADVTVVQMQAGEQVAFLLADC